MAANNQTASLGTETPEEKTAREERFQEITNSYDQMKIKFGNRGDTSPRNDRGQSGTGPATISYRTDKINHANVIDLRNPNNLDIE